MSRRAFRIADVGCGAGGTSHGLWRAGADVTGVDMHPQPRYPYRFIQMDGTRFLEEHAWEYDALFLGPPCQHWSKMSRCRSGLRDLYPDLITPWRDRAEATGLPWIMENVEGAPLINPVMLCTADFGREAYRHRYFESNVVLHAPPHGEHVVPASKAGHWVPGTYISIAGHCAPMWKAREAMGIDWMRREEMVEAIPPVFSEYLGHQLLAALVLSAA